MYKRMWIAGVLGIVSAVAASAGTVLDIPGPLDAGYGFRNYNNGFFGLAGSWNQTTEEDNVTITALVSGLSASVLDAFVTDAHGNTVFSNSVTVPSTGGFVTETFFTGLNLGPGTWDFVLAAPGVSTADWAYELNGHQVTTGAGVTYLGQIVANDGTLQNPLGDFATGGTTDPVFTVTSAAPEPGSLWLAAGGICLLLGLWRRGSTRASSCGPC